MSVGVSGSYKSYFGSWLEKFHKFRIVCPDDIREELTGSISDQSKDEAVWQKAHERTHHLLNNNENVYFSATSLRPLSAVYPFQYPLTTNKIPVYFFIFGDSNDPEGCKRRIRSDLDNGKNRSNVPDEVIAKQYEKFKNLNPEDITEKLRQKGIQSVFVTDKYPFWKFQEMVSSILLTAF